MHTRDIKNKAPKKDFDWLGSHDKPLTIVKQESQSHEKIGSFGTLDQGWKKKAILQSEGWHLQGPGHWKNQCEFYS